MFRRSLCVLAVVAVSVAGCGKNNSNDGPGNPAGPTPPASNRNPVISSATASPTFGIADLQVFNFSAIASDPDNDVLTYTWSIGGQSFPGANQQLVFGREGGSGTARVNLTVNDGRGGTATSSVDVIIGNMTGSWTIAAGDLQGTTFLLTQQPAGFVTGTFEIPGLGPGTTDPAEPGRITAAGELTMRVKIGSFTDFNMTGTMDTTGTIITGSLRGSGFTGQPFVMLKQAGSTTAHSVRSVP